MSHKIKFFIERHFSKSLKIKPRIILSQWALGIPTFISNFSHGMWFVLISLALESRKFSSSRIRNEFLISSSFELGSIKKLDQEFELELSLLQAQARKKLVPNSGSKWARFDLDLIIFQTKIKLKKIVL